jgi:hypothetical protein
MYLRTVQFSCRSVDNGLKAMLIWHAIDSFGDSFIILLCSFSYVAVCKILATELESRLDETGKTHEVLEMGYSVDDVKPKRKTKYQKS